MWEGFDKRWHWLKPIKHQSGSIETYFWHSSGLVFFGYNGSHGVVRTVGCGGRNIDPHGHIV